MRQVKIGLRLWSTGLLILLFLASCVMPGNEAPTKESLNSLAVVSTVPASGGVIATQQSLSLTFADAMNRATVETAISIFPGKYDPAKNPTTFLKLQLTSMCNGKWRVRNPNMFALSFSWDIYNSSTKGVGVVPGNSDVFFYTATGSNTVRVFVGSQQQQVKATNTTTCTGAPFTFTWSADSRTVGFKPTEALAVDKEYTLVVSTGAKRASGAQDATSPFTLSFTVKQFRGIDPSTLTTSSEEIRQRYDAAYARLTPQLKRLLEEGRLHFDGFDFVTPPSLNRASSENNSSVQQGDISAQQIQNYGPQNPFECFVKEGDKVIETVNGEEKFIQRDFGTFYHLGSTPGTADRPSSVVTATFVLPPSKMIKNTAAGQDPYVMVTGKSPATYAEIDPLTGEEIKYGGNFDAGLGHQENGWFMAVNRFNPDPELSSGMTTHLYRLRNYTVDGQGNKVIVPEDQNSESYMVDIRVEIDQDSHLRYTVKPIGNTVWVEVKGDGTNILQLDDQGNPKELILGGDEEGTEDRGGKWKDPNATFPELTVENFDREGVNNRFAFEIDVARDEVSPASGTQVRGIGIYNAKINDRRWQANVPGGDEFGYITTCPQSIEDVYENIQGDTSETNPGTGFSIDINVTKDNIHGCINSDGYLAKCAGGGGSGGGGSDPNADDDGDGITNANESGGANPEGDDDRDGIPNYKDPDFPGFVDTNGDGINDNFDPDLDGIPNHLDPDSDNNGIPDKDEVGNPSNPTDTNSNGIPNYLDPNNDGDDHSDIEEINDGTDPNDANSPGDEQEAQSGESWGDPHIFTPDGGIYTFMATGDYILSEATNPNDPFVIQVRYRPFEGPTWAHVNSTQWSANEAVAMNIHGDIVEFYAVADYAAPKVLINGVVQPSGDFTTTLPKGGTVSISGSIASAAWTDGTALETQLHTSPSGDWALAGSVKLYLPKSRWNKVQGLMGNNDGLVSNDLRLRDGTQLPLNPTPQGYNFSSEELTKALYTGPFRTSWLVQSNESLFSEGTNPYNVFYPSQFISLKALDPQLLEDAIATCKLEGVVSEAILSRCALDIANTGDDLFARVAAAADPISLIRTISVAPTALALTPSGKQDFTAFVKGKFSDQEIVWSATGGTVTGSGVTVTYTAPSEPGVYYLKASINTLEAPAISEAKITVLAASNPTITRVSTKIDGTDIFPPGSAMSARNISMSGNGNLVAFDLSNESVPSSVWLKDLSTGELRQVTDSGGISNPSLSANGKYLVYQSGPPVGSAANVFRLDLETGNRLRLDVTETGEDINNTNYDTSISDDGRYAVFTSTFSQVDYYGPSNIYLKDSSTGAVKRLDVFENADEIVSYNPLITPNGQFVVFEARSIDGISNALMGSTEEASHLVTANLVTTTISYIQEIFLYNAATDTLVRVSATADGIPADGFSFAPSVSADGRFVVFSSQASNLVPSDTNDITDVFLKDMVSGTVTRLSTAQDGQEGNNGAGIAKISADGRYVVFESSASNLVANDTNSATDVFVKDLVSGNLALVSDREDDVLNDGNSMTPELSADGKYIIFTSWASNLVTGDANDAIDVFRVPNPLWK